MTSNREKRLDGKVALVMGGTGGIGRAVAIEFALCGASVSVVGRRVQEGSDVVAEIVNQGGNASFVRGDLSDQHEIRLVIENVMEAYGRIDCAFNNAGIEGPLGDLLNHTEQEIKETFEINVHGLAHSMRLELECMLRQGEGAIVNCASIAGLRGIAAIFETHNSSLSVVESWSDPRLSGSGSPNMGTFSGQRSKEHRF